jgi:hypothetical protein
LASLVSLSSPGVREPNFSKRLAAKYWFLGLSAVGMSNSLRLACSSWRDLAFFVIDLRYSVVPLSFSPRI